MGQCHAMQCNAKQCNVMQCMNACMHASARRCHAMQCNAKQCNVMQCMDACMQVQCNAMRSNAMSICPQRVPKDRPWGWVGAGNPYQMSTGVTQGTLWDLIQEKQPRSSPEARIPSEKHGFPVPPSSTPDLSPGGGGLGILGPGSYIRVYEYVLYIYIYIYVYAYIYIRRPPSGGHQAAKSMLPSACPKSFQSFKSQVDSQVFLSFPVFQSAISCLPICY